MSASSGRPPGSFVEVAAAVRPFVVGVRSAVGTEATGYVALANGAVATSFSCVGFLREAVVALDDGRTVDALVVGADIGRDLAVLAPTTPLGLSPLRPAVSLPPIGTTVLALSRAHSAELSVAAGMLSAVDAGGQHATVERVTAAPAVIVDADGRLLGLTSARGELVAAAAYASLLSQLQMPLADLARVLPVYRCPRCRETLEPELSRCGGCGAALPGLPQVTGAAARVLREVLGGLGFAGALPSGDPPRVRLGRHAVELVVDADGEVIVFRAPVSRLPERGQEAVLRLLLTLNDETTGLHHLWLDGDTVMLSLAEPTTTLSDHNVAAIAGELLRHSEHYARVLGDAYGMPPHHW